jgi:hypothetical protein
VNSKFIAIETTALVDEIISASPDAAIMRPNAFGERGLHRVTVLNMMHVSPLVIRSS